MQLVASGAGKISFTGNTEFFSASTINANSSNITNIASLNTHPLPQGSSTLVDVNSTQVLTNKSISYSQLTGTPTIPTNNNQLTNGANYISASSTDTLTNKTITSFIGGSSAVITSPSNTGIIALTSQIPTNNNQLTNGANYITASPTDTLTNKDFEGNVDISGGTLKIEKLAQALILKGTSSGNANVVYMEIQDSGNVRKGFIGDADSATSDIWVYADDGNIRLRGSDKVRVLSNKLAIGSQSGTTDPKHAILQSPASITADYTLDLPSSAGALALTSDIPTNNNQLTNGANYITASSTDNLTNKT